MSATDLRDRSLISNPGFFARGQARPSDSRVRLVRRPGSKIQHVRTANRSVPAYLQRGFTYIGMLLIVAVMGTGLAAFGQLYSQAAQREKERELLFIGNQFRDAIAGYYNKSPGNKVYPKTLDQLLEDKRLPVPQHHLRKLFRDPMTGSTEWGLVEAPGGGFMGVYSRSEETPIKSANFSAKDQAFEGAEHYTNWMFAYSPTGLGNSVVPAAKR
jgi:type II secretory pathway pseudopilin PulG